MKVLRLLAVAAASLIPAVPTASAQVLLGGVVYPEHMRSELRAACQGLDMQSRESLTEDWHPEKYSDDPASDYYLSRVTFSLRDCRMAGLI